MKTGILLVNLGTPDSARVSDVKKYLKENPSIADEIIMKIKNLTNLTIPDDENAKHNVENTSDV